jgi:signal transduction histidine kinase
MTRMTAARQVAFLRFVPVSIRAPLVTSIAYWAGAEFAFLVGTLSDSIFAPFWPPNSILFCALLSARYADWWRFLVAVFPAHVIAELQIGMDWPQLMVAFLTNCAIALLSAWTIRWLLGRPPWLNTFHRALVFVIVAAGIAPALVAFWGAYVRIFGDGAASDYWTFWLQWYLANALGNLTLTPVILAFFYSGVSEISLEWSRKHLVEIVLVSAAVLLTSVLAIEASIHRSGTSILPTLLYLPMPFVLWATVRFGVRGACLAVLLFTLLGIWSSLSEPSLFSLPTREANVLALQLFLTGLAAPLLLLGAYVCGARQTQNRSHKLSRMALTSNEESQRKMAEDLHEGVCQDLAAAYLKARYLFNQLPADTRSEAAEVEERILEAIGTLRAAAYGMYPPLLAEGGLEPALRSFIHTYTERTGIAVSLHLPSEIGRLDPEIESVAFRIVEEALTNVERHSGSTSALVVLTRSGESADELLLRIEDPEPSAVRRGGVLLWLRRFAPTSVASGLGIAAMTERLHAIGGRLEFRSVGGSTLVEAAFRGAPVRNE